MANGAGRRATRGRASGRWRSASLAEAPAGDGDPLAELKELLRTAGVATAGEMVQVRAEPDPDRYLGRGKLDRAEARDQALAAPTSSPATTSSRRARSETSRPRSACR